MSDLVKRLGIKAGVMEMGERIQWGSETSLMREAARAIEAKDKRIAELEANADALKEERGRLRDALTLINDRASYFLGINEEWLIDVTKGALWEVGNE